MKETKDGDPPSILYEKKNAKKTRSQMVKFAQAFDFAEDVEGREKKKKGGGNKKEV